MVASKQHFYCSKQRLHFFDWLTRKHTLKLFTPRKPMPFENLWSHDGKRPLLAGFYPFPLKNPGVKSVTKFSKSFFSYVFSKPASTFSSRTSLIFQIFMKLRPFQIDASVFTKHRLKTWEEANISQIKSKLDIQEQHIIDFKNTWSRWPNLVKEWRQSLWFVLRRMQIKLTESGHECLSIRNPFV